MNVAEGGHHIPTLVIRRRYQAGLNNLFNIYMNQVDYCLLADNSKLPSITIAEKFTDQDIQIYDQQLYNNIFDHVK